MNYFKKKICILLHLHLHYRQQFYVYQQYHLYSYVNGRSYQNSNLYTRNNYNNYIIFKKIYVFVKDNFTIINESKII